VTGTASAARTAPLDASFFERSVHDVARDLVGCSLLYDGVRGVSPTYAWQAGSSC